MAARWHHPKAYRALLAAVLALIFSSLDIRPSYATSAADAQVEAVFGTVPWKQFFTGPFVVPNNFIDGGGVPCTASNLTRFGYIINPNDLFGFTVACTTQFFGYDANFFRSDLGLDSTGSVPPSGAVTVLAPLGIGREGAPRCSGLTTLNGEPAIDCVFWNFPVPQHLDVVAATDFPIFFSGDSLSLTTASVFPVNYQALSSGGTPKTTVPADGTTTLLFRLGVSNAASAGLSNASFVIRPSGQQYDPAVDGQIFDPIAGGAASDSGILTLPIVNNQAFALYLAPIDYTKDPADGSGQRSLTVLASAGRQPVTQGLTIYRPNPPTLLSEAEKTQFYILGLYLSQVADAFDGASMATDGVGNLARDVAVSTVTKVAKRVLEKNDKLFGQSAEYSLGLVQFLAGVANSIKTNPISTILKGDSFVFGAAALLAKYIGINDPPDSNYTVVAQPSQLSFPSTGNATADRVIADYLNYVSLSAATLHAAERWQGAHLAGDTASQTLQQNAFNQFSAQTATAQSLLTNDNAALAGVLQEPSLASWPNAAADIAAAFNAQCSQPLPSDLNALLLTLVPSQSAVDSLVCSVVSGIKPSDINFDFASLLGVPVPPPASLVAAVLPSSRSVRVGGTATAFATIINTASTTASSCSIVPISGAPANFTYQTTNPATNALSGAPNTPVDIAPGAAQSFVIALTPTAAVDPANVGFSFSCGGTAQAPSISGLDTLLLSASISPVPDIVALAATARNDGILHIPGAGAANAFAVATVNVGAGGSIIATANIGSANLPLSLSICQTDPASGQCLSTPAVSATAASNSGATPTFAIFGNANGPIPFDPANNRIFVQFTDAAGTVRGSTSVAVATQ